MNIFELDNYNLADAVKFHDRLNPRLWGRDEKLLPEVREKLLAIASDFQEFLGVEDLNVRDITVSGSNAAFSYTPNSDIDLHLVVDMPRDPVYQELFNAKKYQYNDEHDITIGGADVELYVQPAEQQHHSQGIYSVKDNGWIAVPKRKKADVDDSCVLNKVEDLSARIDAAVHSRDEAKITALWDKIKTMRQTGLQSHGEFGCDNLAFKMLRVRNKIGELKAARQAAHDKKLSLPEQRRVFRWGLMAEDAGSTWDGVSPTTCMFLNEEDGIDNIVQEFIEHTAQYLGIENMPKIELHNDPAWSEQERSFGKYVPEAHELHVNLHNRHLLDILRTTAHELCHCRQHEIEALGPDAGETGSDMENEAHAVAGIVMRHFADAHPEYFNEEPVEEGGGYAAYFKTPAPEPGKKIQGKIFNAPQEYYAWQQKQKQQQQPAAAIKTPVVKESSGYIPTEAERNDPRFEMALSVDVQPGQTGHEANKMSLHTDAQGHPQLLRADGKTSLSESLAREFAEFSKPKSYGYNSKPLSQVPGEREDELGNQEATGPEFPPQMPAGTTKIDVADLTDWYRLGQDISDLDDADPEDYGKGPPQTVVVFPSDEAEQGYLKQFKRLGLKTHDMDPDVKGGEDVTGKHMKDLDEAFKQLEEQFLGEIKMSPSNLRAEAAKTGALAGMEFEMIVPDVQNPNDDDMEPDYEYDQRVRDIDDAVNFFDDGDYNGRNELRRLREAMESDYMDWKFEKLAELWDENGFEFFQEYLDREDPFDEEDYLEQAIDMALSKNPDLQSGTDEYDDAVREALDEINANYYVEKWEEQGRSYDYAQEEFNDEQSDDISEEDWLNDQGIRYASDVESNYSHVTWPYYSRGGDGEADVDSIANEFSDMIGKPVNASSNYHGARREPGHYVVEPDGSLEADDSDDAGLEFVSPPMPIDELISDLNKVKAWAGERGCYTNNSTGLHINISVPNFSIEKLDYVKLALLLGDKYILDQYGRAGNTYCKSAIDKVQQKIKSQPETAKTMLDKMRSGMEELASKAIHSGSTDKYTSINTKSGYIEFRSPGGDWLDANFDKIENTLLRFTVALSAAMDPQAYREEYLKKLYKLLEPTAVETKRPDTIKYFADYVAGKTPKAALRSFIKQAQLQRQVKRGEAGDQQMWWRVSNPGNSFGEIEVVARTREEAIEKAMGPDGYPSWANTRQSIQAEPLRPYQEPTPQSSTTSQSQGNWGFWITSANRFARMPGQSDNNVIRRFNSREEAEQFAANTPGIRRDLEIREIEPAQSATQFGSARGAPNYAVVRVSDGEVVHRFHAADRSEALGVKHDWVQAQGWGQRDYSLQDESSSTGSRNALSQTDIENRLGWPDQTGDANYEVVDRQTLRPVFVFIANTDQDAQRKYGQFLDAMMLPHDTENYGYRARGSVMPPVANQMAQSSAQRNYTVRDASGYAMLVQAVNPNAAMQWARENYPRQFPNIVDVVLAGSSADLQQQRAQSQASTGGNFTGEWKLVDAQGQEIYRFSGVGNNQGDANNVAIRWLRDNPRYMVPGVEVVPVMG